MKLIKPNKLKEGDWFRTQPIYNSLNKKNEIMGIYSLCYVEKIKGKDIYIKNWVITGNKIVKGAIFSAKEEIYLLNKKELMEFNKRLILLSLEEKNGIHG